MLLFVVFYTNVFQREIRSNFKRCWQNAKHPYCVINCIKIPGWKCKHWQCFKPAMWIAGVVQCTHVHNQRCTKIAAPQNVNWSAGVERLQLMTSTEFASHVTRSISEARFCGLNGKLESMRWEGEWILVAVISDGQAEEDGIENIWNCLWWSPWKLNRVKLRSRSGARPSATSSDEEHCRCFSHTLLTFSNSI